MIKEVFMVRDTRAGVYSNPFVSIRREIALRDFGRAANDGQSEIYHYPDDFALYYCGTFNDESGKIDWCEPEYIQTASFLRKFDPEV